MAKNGSKQKPEPSKYVLDMVKARKAKKQASTNRAKKREDSAKALLGSRREASDK
jgi:hypothetical protein